MARLLKIIISFISCLSHSEGSLIYGKYLPNNIISEIYSVSLVTCAKDCSSRKSCLSINYQRSYKRCILNDALMTSASVVKTTDSDVAYLDIANWPETLRDCDGFSCRDRERCTVDTSGRTTCIPSECPDVTRPDYGTILEYGRSVGDIVTYECDVGYERDIYAPSVCQENGQWSYLPRCQQTVCPPVPEISQARANTTDRVSGTVVSYICNSGYIGKGPDITRCDNSGQWTDTDFECFYDCGTPDVITGAAVVNNYTHATYTCTSGFMSVIGQSDDTVVCSESIRGWTQSNFLCVAVCPPVPGIANSEANTTARYEGTVVGYTCLSGFILTGVETIICNTRQQWSDPDFKCFFDCGAPSSISNTDFFYNETHTIYYCAQGYVSLSGPPQETIECSEKDRAWTSASISCVDDPCQNGYNLIYEVDETGSVLTGSFADLKDKVMSGLTLRIMISESQSDKHHIIEVSSVTTSTNDIIASSIHNDERLLSSATSNLVVNRLYYTVSSSGLITESRWMIGMQTMLSQTSYQSHTSWFADMDSFQSIYTYDPVTAIASGSITDLVEKASKGSEIQVMIDNGVLHNPGSIEYTTTQITIQNVWYLGNLISLSPTSRLHWSLNLLDPTDGSMSEITWYTESNDNHFSDRYTFQDWIYNDCWDLKYENDASGNSVTGNLYELIDLIKSGHRVRVDTEGRLEEALSIRVDNGVVWVQTLDSAVQDMNANFNANNPSRVFRSISTSGVIFASHCGNGECIAQTAVKKNMKWYVDKAVWENMLVHSQQNQAGGFTSQSAMQNLLNKVKTGRKVRLHINDYSDLDIFVNADHVTIDGGTSTTDAASVNHLYVTPGVSIPMSPDWQFLYVTTASYYAVIVRMNYFYHQQTFEDEREVETTWFVN